MAIIQIPNLPAATGLSGPELFEGVQAGSSVKISLNQIIAAARAGLPTTLPIPVSLGGTGLSSFTAGDITYASATTMTTGALANLAAAATGNALLSGTSPSWGKIGLTTHVSGTLPIANGGTGVTTAPAEAARIMGYSTTATAAGTTVLTNTSSQYQVFTGVTTQTITLPVTSTLNTGWCFRIVNNSTGNLTVNSSGANLVASVPPGMSLALTCIGTTLPTAADWEFGFTDFGSITGTGANVLTDGPTITNGALNGTVGATTASTGAFTSLTSTSGGINGTVGAATPNTGAFTTVTTSTSVLSTGTGGVGYATGAGVAVTQLTSRTTAAPTTGAKTTGAITLFTTTAVVGTYFSFTVPNTGIAVTDTVVLSVRGATNTYVAFVTAITAATSFQITMASVAGTVSDTPIVNFSIIKGVSA